WTTDSRYRERIRRRLFNEGTTGACRRNRSPLVIAATAASKKLTEIANHIHSWLPSKDRDYGLLPQASHSSSRDPVEMMN
ncbi:hypothetical protein pipiens_004221, partial [Culex pipiens pipiens]